MDLQDLSIGISALIIAYAIYFFGIKRRTHSLKDPNGNGPTMATYYSQHVWVFFLIIFGVIFIMKSFPAEI